MNDTVNTTAISGSLINKNIYAVCCTELESIDHFHGELYALRKAFYEGGMHRCRQKGKGEYLGCEARFSGALKKGSIKWKKLVEKVKTEEAFLIQNAFVVVLRDLNDNICGKIYYDRDLRWTKTEYFSPEDYMTASTILKPRPSSDSVERFTYNRKNKNYDSKILYPVPYAHGSVEQSVLNEKYGDQLVLVAMDTGEFSYCSKEEQKRRLKTLEELKKGSLSNAPVWEGEEAQKEPEPEPKEPELAFESLFEAAEPQPEKAKEETAVTVEKDSEEETAVEESRPAETAEPEVVPGAEPVNDKVQESVAEPEVENGFVPEDEPGPVEIPISQKSGEPEPQESPDSQELPPTVELIPANPEEPSLETADLVLEVEEEPRGTLFMPQEDPMTVGLISDGKQYNYTGRLLSGKREGRGRTDRVNGLTVFDGEYREGLRHGFGCSYTGDGGLSYAGFWQEDKKEGAGISFREADHAMHVTRWHSGKPGEYATLFGPTGELRYSGRLLDGKKNGVGITLREEDGGVFVGKYSGGDVPQEGALFDAEGNLLYTGGWKDGKRHGQGTEFDRNGRVVYSGEWENDHYLNGILYQKLHGEN